MKTIKLKQSIHIILFCTLVLITVIITKNTIKNIKYLYSSETRTTNAASCFFDLID